VHLLEDFEFIRVHDDGDFKSADSLDESGKITATLLGQRVAQLYLDPLTAHELMEGLKRASSAKVEPFSFLQLVSHTLEMRPHLRVKVREYEDIQEKLARHEDFLLTNIPSLFDVGYDQFLNTVKTALFLNDWIDEQDEEILLERYDIRPGEIRYKLDNADWLFYACEELARLMSFQPLLKEISRVRFRVRYGVKEELLTLLKLKNVGRVRARKLFDNRLKNIADVRKADIAALAQLVGPGIAKSIKEQLGEKVDKVPKGRRKGQISIKKF
jgi:helicase